MLKKLAATVVHIAFFALVAATAAYWAVRIFTPPPTSAPPPIAVAPLRDPDPIAAARLFGKVESAPQAVVSNVQVVGLFAAGRDSSAVLAVDGKPARAYLLGQEVTPGSRLVAVTGQQAVLEANGVQQEIRMPPRAVLSLGGSGPALPTYSLQGNTMSAPSGAGAGAPGGQGINRPAPYSPPMPPNRPIDVVPPPANNTGGPNTLTAPPGVQGQSF